MEAILASVILPAVIDLFKGAGSALSRKWLGLSVEDQIKLQTSDMERLKALAELDNPHGTPDQWVVNLRGSFRYIAAIICILAGMYLLTKGQVELGTELIGMPFGFVFGERLYLGLKGPKNK